MRAGTVAVALDVPAGTSIHLLVAPSKAVRALACGAPYAGTHWVMPPARPSCPACLSASVANAIDVLGRYAYRGANGDHRVLHEVDAALQVLRETSAIAGAR